MNKDCNGCPHCVDRKDQYGWHFKGCFGGPYNGKFIAEIDGCPLKQEQPDFPTTNEQVKEFLATHPKVEVPQKYKTPDWIFEKSEKPMNQEGLDEETIRIEFHTIADKCFNEGIEGWEREKLIARHFAKWQKEHDAELIEIAYNDGITIGMTKQKEQMLREAVKWLVDDDYDTQTDKGRFILGSAGIGYNGYYIPYSDLLKLPKED